jgi:hypothetical protein
MINKKLFRDLFGSNGDWVMGFFDKIEIAGSALESFLETCPDPTLAAWVDDQGFLLMQPRSGCDMTPLVYEKHCQEIIGRLSTHQDTRPGTFAEVLWTMINVSLKAPLTQDGYAICYYLYKELDFEYELLGHGEWEPRGSHDTAIIDEINITMKKLRQDWRKPTTTFKKWQETYRPVEPAKQLQLI